MPTMKCEHCGKQFGSEHGLNIHVGRQHGSKAKAKHGRKKAVARVTCDVCGRMFRLPLHLGRHMSAAHGTGGKKTARRAGGRGRTRMPAGLHVSGLTIDQLLSLKSAVDGRLAEIGQKIRQAKVGI